jgi:integrase
VTSADGSTATTLSLSLSLSLMEKAGVPISIVSKWAGHYDAAFTMRTYIHASDDDLKQGRNALAKIHKIA